MNVKLTYNDVDNEFDVEIEPSSTDVVVPPLLAMVRALALFMNDPVLFSKAVNCLIENFGKNAVHVVMVKLGEEVKDVVNLMPNTFLAEIPLVHPITLPPIYYSNLNNGQ